MVTEPPDRKSRMIGLADLVRALRALDNGAPGVAEQIGRCLGFTGLDPNPEEARHGAWDGSVASEAPSVMPSSATIEPVTMPPPQLPKRPELAGEPLVTDLERMDPLDPPPRPEWLNRPHEVTPREPALTFQTLLPARTAHPVLSAALNTLKEGFDPDVQRLIEHLVHGRAVSRLPMLPRGSLECGVDLLLDHGEGMTPFYDDLKVLASQVREVVGNDRYRGFGFRGDPGEAAGRRRGRHREPWRPIAGRPVLVATDFGIGAPPGSRERAETRVWRDFADHCRKARVPLVGLVPLHPSHWPHGLGRWFKLIHWDPRTRASTVRHLVGLGHAAPQ
jgi:hypothetical protein